MLVLTRKTDQSILIGEQVVVRILGVQGNTVRLGIEAPRSVSIVRGELLAAAETGQPAHEGKAEAPLVLSVKG